MKIGIIGTHGVGKTTICKYLSYFFGQSSRNNDIIIEVVRPLVLQGLPNNEGTTFEAQEAILYYQMVQEIIAEARMKRGDIRHAIQDRTVIDNYVYAEHAFPDLARERLFDLATRWLEEHPYGALFKVPLWTPEKITADGVRSVNKDFQTAIDEKLGLLLDELEIEYQTLPAEYFRLPLKEQGHAFGEYFAKRFD